MLKNLIDVELVSIEILRSRLDVDKSYQIPPGFLNRKMLREQANISEHDLKSLEGQGLVKATRRNNYGWHLYPETVVPRVAELAVTLRAKREEKRAASEEPTRLAPAFREPVVPYSVEQYRAVLTQIDAGVTFDKIPMKVDIHPSIVLVILKDFEHLAGTFVVDKLTVTAINRLAIPGIEVKSSKELISAFEKLRDAIEKPPACKGCGKKRRKICLDCAAKLYQTKGKPIAANISNGAAPQGSPAQGT
jgi:hypothetical protein